MTTNRFAKYAGSGNRFARFAQQDGQAPEPENTEADRALRRFRNRFTMGLADAPFDAVAAGLASLAPGSEGFGAEYERQRQLTRKALNQGDRGTAGSIGDVIVDTAALTGQAVATAPLTVARTGTQMMQGGWQTARELLSQAVRPGSTEAVRQTVQAAAVPANRSISPFAETVRLGTAFGSAGGYGASEGDVGEQLASMATHAVGGAAFAAGLHGAVTMIGNFAVQPIVDGWRRVKTQVAERAHGAAAEFADAGVPEFGPALVDSPVMRGTAEGLSGTFFGSALRSGARRSIEAVERGVLDEMQRAGGVRTAAEAGDETQAFLRRQLTERSILEDEIKGMDQARLQDISGVAPGPKYNPSPPRVPAVQPEAIEPVTPQAYLDEVARSVPETPPRIPVDVEFAQPTLDDVPLPPPLLNRLRETSANLANAQREAHEMSRAIAAAEAQITDEMGAAGIRSVRVEAGQAGGYIPRGALVVTRADGSWYYVDLDGTLRNLNGGLPPQERMAITRAAEWLRGERPNMEAKRAEVERLTVARDRAAREADEYRRARAGTLANERRTAALREAEADARAEAARATQRARNEAVERHRPIAEYEARHQTEKRRLNAEIEARRETERRQAASDAAFLADVERRKARASETIVIGRSRETYPTEFDAAYEQVHRNTPAVQRNLLGTKAESATATETTRLLDQIAQEARGKGQLPGYRKGQLFADDGRMRADVLDYLRPKLGREVADILAYYSDRRAANQFAPGIQGMQDMRTIIGRTIGDLRKRGASGYAAEPRSEDDALLSRLYRALDRDIKSFERRAGPAGELVARQRTEVDAAYEAYVNDIRRPLARVFGEQTDPVAAIGELVKATQRGGKIDLLRAFYKVVDDKGDRLIATNALLHGMAEDGLEGFLRTWRSLSSDARKIMFQGAAAEYGRTLERLARVGGRLERFARTAKGDYAIDLTRGLHPGNLVAALLGYFNIPLAIKYAVGAEGLSRLLASKAFATWLKAMPQVVEHGPASVAWRRHMTRLRGIAIEQLGINEETADTLLKALTDARGAR